MLDSKVKRWDKQQPRGDRREENFSRLQPEVVHQRDVSADEIRHVVGCYQNQCIPETFSINQVFTITMLYGRYQKESTLHEFFYQEPKLWDPVSSDKNPGKIDNDRAYIRNMPPA